MGRVTETLIPIFSFKSIPMEKNLRRAIPIFIQTSFPTQPELDRWQQITEEEARVVYQMTLANELSGGTPTVRQFEKDWRTWSGLSYSLTTFNGTSALYCSYFGIGLGPGDEIICPTYTWICTIAPALFLGARPVFAESDPLTLQLDPADVEKRITPKTRAIVAVHLWGNVCDMDRLMAISQKYGIPIVEDCAHAHGALWDGRMTGSIGQVGAWSLQGSKALSAGEGGVLATDDPEIFERACLCGQVNRLGGLDLATPKYSLLQPLGLGMKFRAHPLGIGIAGVQLKKLASLNARREEYFETIEAFLRKTDCFQPLKIYSNARRGGYYAFPILYDSNAHNGLPRDEMIRFLMEEGLQVSISPYGLLHRLPLFAQGFDLFTRHRGPLCEKYAGYGEGDFPITESVFRKLIFLPVLSDPVPGAFDKVIQMIERALRRSER
jgi:perosamine synthetase